MLIHVCRFQKKIQIKIHLSISDYDKYTLYFTFYFPVFCCMPTKDDSVLKKNKNLTKIKRYKWCIFNSGWVPAILIKGFLSKDGHYKQSQILWKNVLSREKCIYHSISGYINLFWYLSSQSNRLICLYPRYSIQTKWKLIISQN